MWKNNPIFLIGNQRSGTTWIANVVNTSPETVLFFEPFEKGLHLYDDFPEEPLHIEQSSETLLSRLKKQYHEMLSLEESFLKMMTLPAVFVAGINQVARFDPLWRLTHKVNRFRKLQVINQFRSANYRGNFGEKHKTVRPLIKETRLHLKLEVLSDAFPEIKICHLVRHPYPVIKSSLKWMKRGRLLELTKKLDYFFDVYRTQKSFDRLRFKEVIELGLQGSLDEKVLAHWLISNDIAYSFCKEHPGQANVFYYENFCANAVQEFRRLFEFYRLTFERTLEELIAKPSLARNGDDTITSIERISSQKVSDWLTQDVLTDPLYLRIEDYAAEFEVLRNVSELMESVDATTPETVVN